MLQVLCWFFILVNHTKGECANGMHSVNTVSVNACNRINSLVTDSSFVIVAFFFVIFWTRCTESFPVHYLVYETIVTMVMGFLFSTLFLCHDHTLMLSFAIRFNKTGDFFHEIV